MRVLGRAASLRQGPESSAAHTTPSCALRLRRRASVQHVSDLIHPCARDGNAAGSQRAYRSQCPSRPRRALHCRLRPISASVLLCSSVQPLTELTNVPLTSASPATRGQGVRARCLVFCAPFLPLSAGCCVGARPACDGRVLCMDPNATARCARLRLPHFGALEAGATG